MLTPPPMTASRNALQNCATCTGSRVSMGSVPHMSAKRIVSASMGSPSLRCASLTIRSMVSESSKSWMSTRPRSSTSTDPRSSSDSFLGRSGSSKKPAICLPKISRISWWSRRRMFMASNRASCRSRLPCWEARSIILSAASMMNGSIRLSAWRRARSLKASRLALASLPDLTAPAGSSSRRIRSTYCSS